MKKIISIITALALLLSLGACHRAPKRNSAPRTERTSHAARVDINGKQQ